MKSTESAEPTSQVESLAAERDDLLRELEAAYREMEVQLEASQTESSVTYLALRSRNEELQQRLAELEKTHRELKEAQQLLLRSERLAAMGQMAAAIMHEVKNPLSVIVGRLELIKVFGKAPTDADIESLHRSALYLVDLTRNALGFARKQQHGATKEVDPNAILHSVLDFVQPIYKQVQIELTPSPGVPAAWADPAQVEQVVMNLVLNAVDALGTGNGRITLSTDVTTIELAQKEAEEVGHDSFLAVEADEVCRSLPYVAVRVSDNGPGIPEAALPRLFEAFFTTKEEGKGTGLGLSIVRTIVEDSGGNILVASKEGGGAHFTFFLPLPPDAKPGSKE